MEGLATAAGKLLLDRGGIWAAACLILLAGVIYLFKRLSDAQDARVADAKTLAGVVERSNTTLGAITATMEARSAVLLEVKGAIQALAQVGEADGDLIRAKLDELLRAIERLERRP